MKCDHVATRASLAAFFGSTRLIGGQDDGDGGWLLLGVCVGCNSTLGIQIAEPRGHALHGEIGAVPTGDSVPDAGGASSSNSEDFFNDSTARRIS